MQLLAKQEMLQSLAGLEAWQMQLLKSRGLLEDLAVHMQLLTEQAGLQGLAVRMQLLTKEGVLMSNCVTSEAVSQCDAADELHWQSCGRKSPLLGGENCSEVLACSSEQQTAHDISGGLSVGKSFLAKLGALFDCH